MREPDLRDAELSPDGTHLALITNEGKMRTVSVRDITKPDMPIVGAFQNAVTRPNYLYWANDDRLLVVLSVPHMPDKARREYEKNGEVDFSKYFMLSRTIAVNKDASDAAVLMEDERRLRGNSSLSRISNFIPNDPDHVLMAAYRSGRRSLYRVNVYTGDAELVVTGSTRTFGFLSDDDGNPQFRFDYYWRSRSIGIHEYLGENKWNQVDKIYLNRDDEDSIDSADLIALYDDDLVYRKQSEESGYYELLLIDRESGERTTLASLPDQDIKGVLLDRQTDQIVGYTVESDFVRHVYFDEARQEAYDAILAAVGNKNFVVAGGSGGGANALVRTWGPRDPRSYYLWNADSGQLTFLSYAYHGLATENLSMSFTTDYKARDGQDIHAYVLVPQDYESGKVYPTIVLPHGGPHARSRADYDDFTQFLSTRGYVVIEPNFRGSVGYGRDFEEAGYREWGGVMQDDLTDAVKFLVDEGISDPDRVCIVGASYGGYAALMGAIKTPDLYQCAVSLNGVTHLADMVKYDKKSVDKDEWQTLLYDRVGDPKADRDMLDRNSPALHADKIKIPVMIVAGTEDDVVPFRQAKMMEKALRSAEAEFEFIRLENTGHNPFYYSEDKKLVFEEVGKFLQEHLDE